MPKQKTFANVGQILKMWREEAQESHWSLSKKCPGVSAQAIRAIEVSTFGRASLELVRKISKSLGHTLADLEELLTPD